jgi:hypothetical protein
MKRFLAALVRNVGWPGLIIFLGTHAIAHETNSLALSGTNAPVRSRLCDPQDGWLDMSGFLDTSFGFVPVVVPITEPAVGYGAGGGLIFIDKKEPASGEEFQKPNIAAIGGMATENGSWAAFGGHSGTWFDDKLETMVGAGYGSINLDFYGIGDGRLNNHPLGYNLEPLGGLVDMRYRIARSPLRIGFAYAIASTEVSFDHGNVPASIKSFELDSRVSGFIPKIVYDSRNNVFTPTKGIYGEADFGIFREALGGSSDFEKVSLTGIYYHPLASRLTLGVRADAEFSFDDVPFYTRPFINLRGVAIRRYVGEHAAEVEVELRWQLWRRFSLVGFGGTGVAWNDFERLESEQVVVTGGTGFRYELARKYGLHMGADVGFGPDGPVLYIQFGSAWFRP